MSDLNHYIGGDIAVSATADVGVAVDLTASQQRVLRRLLTNPGDYIWHPDYGAGLPAEVGKLADERRIRGLIKSQIFKEASVLQSPAPIITVTMLVGGVSVRIWFADAQTGQLATLSFDVNR
ncbi:MAG: phage tail protein [Rhodoferax sp.]|uniref:phage tail protein n=1 Tax=Rhodoferax sp. TaxID=50421 RepID=UPI00182FFBDB|nr:phage tail protein [Rhodoferax sp.]NMM21851.1 phage tail protein [Rhodoferax sp.]